MKLKTGLIFVLSVLLLCVTLTACKKDEETPEPDDGGDDYSGSIAPEDGNQNPGGEETEEPVDEGDPNATYEIFTAEDLKTKLKMKGTYVLKADIDLGGAEWKPVGSKAHPFAGTFNGGGFKISNFKVTEKPAVSEGDVSLALKYAYGGFFGVTENATVKDVTFDGITVNISLTEENTFIYAGTVVGYAKNTVLNGITVTNTVISARSVEHITYVGGLTGSMWTSSANNCSVNATLNAKESLNDAYCGGITGELREESALTRCSSGGLVSSVAKYGKSYAGGLIGYCSSSKVSKCVAASAVNATVSSHSPETGKKGSAYAGGFAAIVTAPTFNNRSEFSESYTTDTCTVTATGNKNAAYAGGFAAYSAFGIYTYCYSRSNVTGESTADAVYAAGLIANLINYEDDKNEKATPYPYDTRIEECFSTGNVNVKISTMAYFIGTLIYTDSSVKDNFILESSYYQNMNFYINNTIDNANDKIQKDGSAITSATYGNLHVLNWSTDVWEIKPGDSFPTLKPAT